MYIQKLSGSVEVISLELWCRFALTCVLTRPSATICVFVSNSLVDSMGEGTKAGEHDGDEALEQGVESDELDAARRVSGTRRDVLIAVVCCSVHIAETHYVIQMSNFRYIQPH